MGAIHSPEAVFNQPPPLENYNLYDGDCALKEAVHREGGGWIDEEARKLGEVLGNPEIINLGVLAIGLRRNCEPTIDSVIASTK